MSSKGKSGTETAVPQSKRMRANIKCVVPGLYSDDDSSVAACSESVVCASFEGCTVCSSNSWLWMQDRLQNQTLSVCQERPILWTWL